MSDLHEAAEVVRQWEADKIEEVSQALSEKATPLEEKALQGKDVEKFQQSAIDQAKAELLATPVREEAFNPPSTINDPKMQAERQLESALTHAGVGENVARQIVAEQKENIQETIAELYPEKRGISFM